MDPGLYELLEGDPDDEVAALIRLRDAEAVPAGLRIITRFGDVATCRLKRSAILETRIAEEVTSLKAPRFLTPEPDVDGSDADFEFEEGVHTHDERRPAALPEMGRGTVVGVVDWGVDFVHPDFRWPDGTTRFLAIWDQRGGPRPGSPAPYGYGVVYTAEQIDRALTAADPYAALGYHPAEADIDGNGAHGTHVLDIAAGNGRGGGPAGVAPEAALVFVHMDATGTAAPANLGDSVSLPEAVDFIFRIAADRPCVINLSLGRHWGSHDGTSLVEQALDAALATAPGRAISQSVGNYYERRVHAAGQLRPGEVRTLHWETDEADLTRNELEVWYSHRDRLAIEVEAPDGTRSRRVQLEDRETLRVGGRVVCRIYQRANEPNNLDHHINVFVYPRGPAGTWTVRLFGEDVIDGRFHAWIERDAACRGCQSTFSPRDADPTTTTGSICNGLRTIAVGAYNSHAVDWSLARLTSGDALARRAAHVEHASDRPLARFSSSGPTRDGRVKPDVVAPGVAVLAARSARREGETPLLTRKSGTSMAAPHVAGTIACMFEAAGRKLPIETTRRLLLEAADTSGRTADTADRIGSGYLDIEAAVTAARRLRDEEAAAAVVRTAAAGRSVAAGIALKEGGDDAMSAPETEAVGVGTHVLDTWERTLEHADRALPVVEAGGWETLAADLPAEEAELLEVEAHEVNRYAEAGELEAVETEADLGLSPAREADAFESEDFTDSEGLEAAAAEQDGRAAGRLLGRLTLGGSTIAIGATDAAAHTAATLDAAIRHAIAQRPRHAAVLGNVLTGTRFEVHQWEPRVDGGGAAMLPATLPPVVRVEPAAGVELCALLLNGGAAAYVPADPAAPPGRWVQIPRLVEFYGLPDADQTAHRTAWVGRISRARAGYTRAQLTPLSMPALRLLLARNAAAVFPVGTVRRGTPPTDRGGVVHGVTLPVLRFPIDEPDCYLPVIAEVEGKLESVNAWDAGAGVSIGPIQFNVKRGALFRFLAALAQRDPDLFAQEFGTPLGWTVQQDGDHTDLVINAGRPDAVTLHGRATGADEDRNARYFQSGTPGGRGYNPAFRGPTAERFRNVLVWPHVQEIVLETSAWWLGAGLRALHDAGYAALDTRSPDRDTFILKAMLLSAYVRFSGCLAPLLRGLRRWTTVAEKLANWQTALGGTPAPCPTLRERLTRQRGHARNVHAQVVRLASLAGGQAGELSEQYELSDLPEPGLRSEQELDAAELDETALEIEPIAASAAVEAANELSELAEAEGECVPCEQEAVSVYETDWAATEAIPAEALEWQAAERDAIAWQSDEGEAPSPEEIEAGATEPETLARQAPETGDATDEQQTAERRDAFEAAPHGRAARSPGLALVEMAGELVATAPARPGLLLSALVARAPAVESLIPGGAGEVPSPARLFELFATGYAGNGAAAFADLFEVVGLPGGRLRESVQAGDLLLRRSPGEPDSGHLAVIVEPELGRDDELAAAGLRAERRGPGRYARVVEGGPFPHRLDDAYARLVADATGRVPPNQLVLRPSSPLLNGLTEIGEAVTRRSPEYIRWVQESLNQLMGVGLVVDGIAGRNTRAAVTAFQRQKGLVADGVVGPITERAMMEAGAPPPPGFAGSLPVPPPVPPLPPPVPPGPFNPNDVVDPRIDVCAQFALLRMNRADPAAQADAAGILAAVKGGQLTGVVNHTTRAAVDLAARHGLTRFDLLPAGEDATLVLDPADPLAGTPTIVFRGVETRPGERVPCPAPERMDPALRRAWAAFLDLRARGAAGDLARCEIVRPGAPPLAAGSDGARLALRNPLANIIPPIICAQPAPPQVVPPLTPNPAPPAGFVLLTHPHVRRTCTGGTSFSSATSATPMSPSTMNPGFLKADDSIQFDAALDARLVNLLVDTPKYAVMLAGESRQRRAPSAGDKIRVALVDLTGDKICAPGFAGWGSTTPVPGGSTAKIGILYAAHQLLFDLNELARAGSVATAADLKTKALNDWSGITCKPDLNWLVDVDESTTPVTTRASSNLRQHLQQMVTATAQNNAVSTSRASELILRLGFEYIASVLWQSGLRHPTRQGLWFGNTFRDIAITARPNPACHSGANPIMWTRNPLGATGITLTALSAAAFFTLLAQRRLVNASASGEMENLLATGCRFISTPGVAIRATKCGLTSRVRHDAALIESGTRLYVLVCLTTDPGWPARDDFMADVDNLIRSNNP